MQICVAQTRPVKGDIQSNINSHKNLINLAVSLRAELIIFPELSITGYEPTLAKELATTANDSLFDDFQNISNTKRVAIGLGVPTKNMCGVCISVVIFQPDAPRQVYSKKYLHADEEPFFVSGENLSNLKIHHSNVALAICYELSIPDHSENASKNGAQVYIASVAKSARGVEQGSKILSEIANKYSMMVMMANCIGPLDDFVGGGKTAIWNKKGEMIAQLDDSNEGILIIDTETQAMIEKTIQN
jgi:predicted amidohydrolase